MKHRLSCAAAVVAFATLLAGCADDGNDPGCYQQGQHVTIPSKGLAETKGVTVGGENHDARFIPAGTAAIGPNKTTKERGEEELLVLVQYTDVNGHVAEFWAFGNDLHKEGVECSK